MICSGAERAADSGDRRCVTDTLAAHGAKPAHVEGYDRSEWVLLDYFDFVVHIFAPETRLFYGLERLWGNAERWNSVEPEPRPRGPDEDAMKMMKRRR